MPKQRRPHSDDRRFFLVMAAGFVLLGVLLLRAVNAQRDAPPPPICVLMPRPSVSVEASRLATEWQADQAAAQRRYGGELLELYEVVGSVYRDSLGYVTVKLEVITPGVDILCASAPSKALSSLKSGLTVRLWGRLDEERSTKERVRIEVTRVDDRPVEG